VNQQDERTRNRKKLESLLRDLFQFDQADLDFGIYRIMNQKRDEVERFIEHDLLGVVEEALARFQQADREELEPQLAEKRALLGDAAFDETGAVREQFSGLQLMCLMYAGMKRTHPEADTGMPFDEAYATALSMYQSGE